MTERVHYEGLACKLEDDIGQPMERPDDLRRLAADLCRSMDKANAKIEHMDDNIREAMRNIRQAKNYLGVWGAE